MPRFEVFLTRGAERDLAGIHGYIEATGSVARADALLDQILEMAEALGELPQRGHPPKELEVLGIRDYLQVHVGPYRLIYRVLDARVYIYVIVDGRRNLQSLLERRLLRP